jgi:hypothetical protein
LNIVWKAHGFQRKMIYHNACGVSYLSSFTGGHPSFPVARFFFPEASEFDIDDFSDYEDDTRGRPSGDMGL